LDGIEDPNTPVTSHAEMCSTLANGINNPPAALVAKPRRRGLEKEAIYLSVGALQTLFEAWKQYVEESGGVEIERETGMILLEFEFWSGLMQ
jgi:hypothetical protein